MAIDLSDWEGLSSAHKLAVKLTSEQSFLQFMRNWFQINQGMNMMVNWHHRYMCQIAEEVVSRDRYHTIVNLPPGGTKTETWSIFFPAWAFLQSRRRQGKSRFLNISYSDDLVKGNARRTLELMCSAEWQELWPSATGKKAVDEWSLLNDRSKTQFEMVSRSSGGQITGKRGGFPGPEFSGTVTLDDFDKPEDMFSKVKRERQERILVNTVSSRLIDKTEEHPTSLLSIQQRLHIWDATAIMLAGKMAGIRPGLIKIPALINEDYIDSLPKLIRDRCWKSVKDTPQANGYWSYWPQMESVKRLMELWELSEYTFMSQYMQDPIALGGQLFDPSWWLFYSDDREDKKGFDLPHPAAFEYRFVTADTAQKAGEEHDWSVFCHWGFFQGRLYLIDTVRGKFEAPELRQAFIDFVNECWSMNSPTWGHLRSVYIEDKSSGTGLIQEAQREIPLPVTPIPRGPGQNKLVRAKDTTPQIKLGKVVLPAGKPWITAFVSEHSLFTADDTHDNDDWVDNTCDAVEIALLQAGTFNAGILRPSRKG